MIKKKLRSRVIDFKDSWNKRSFKIGHSKKSETFFPILQPMPGDDDTYIIDCPGLQDNDGDLIHMINSFIFKKLFNEIQNLIILIPFPVGALKNARGASIVSQLDVIIQSFEGNLLEISDSVVPIA